MIKKYFSLGFVGSVAVVLSVVVTSLLLFYMWSWLNPTDFWQKLIALLVSGVAGIVVFIVLAILFTLILVFITALFWRRRIVRKMRKEATGLEGYE